MTYIEPNLATKSFTCPHCGVLARQEKWGYTLDRGSNGCYSENLIEEAPLAISRCGHCGQNCLWVNQQHVFPEFSLAPPPNADMPTEVKADYDEAASICQASPRGAAALLRLAVQKLMVHLRQPGKNINDDIAALVAAGLPRNIQQALDVVRVTGNNAVHPGQLNADDVAIAANLFPLINLVVEYQISMPKQVQALYESLPQSALNGIQKRDKP